MAIINEVNEDKVNNKQHKEVVVNVQQPLSEGEESEADEEYEENNEEGIYLQE